MSVAAPMIVHGVVAEYRAKTTPHALEVSRIFAIGVFPPPIRELKLAPACYYSPVLKLPVPCVHKAIGFWHPYPNRYDPDCGFDGAVASIAT